MTSQVKNCLCIAVVAECQSVVVYRPSRLHSMFWNNNRCIQWMWTVLNCFSILFYIPVKTSYSSSGMEELAFRYEDSEY